MNQLLIENEFAIAEHRAGFHRGLAKNRSHVCSECFKLLERSQIKVGSMDWRESQNHDRAVLREHEQGNY